MGWEGGRKGGMRVVRRDKRERVKEERVIRGDGRERAREGRD